MVESEYWSRLEYRICREFAGMSEGRMRNRWCDGITPGAYLLNDPKPRILGHAWICNGPDQEEWKFELLLPEKFGSRDEIDWQSLFPAENVTRWLALDQPRKLVQIEPSAAVPDLD